MRNPYDSWDKSDTTIDYKTGSIGFGDNDILLMKKNVNHCISIAQIAVQT